MMTEQKILSPVSISPLDERGAEKSVKEEYVYE